MSLWAILAAPLVLGTDLRDIAPAILSVIGNHEVVAVDQDPAGNQGVILRETVDGEIVAKALSTRGQKAVALLDRSAEPLTLSVDLTDLHLSASAGAAVHDVWRGTTGQVGGKASRLAWRHMRLPRRVRLSLQVTALKKLNRSPCSLSSALL